MNLKKASDEEKLNLCRTYFRIGLLFLPLVWLVNCVWFFREAFIAPTFPSQKQIQKYVILSMCGVAVWTALFTTWQVIFQTHRVYWGQWGDYLSCVYPMGVA